MLSATEKKALDDLIRGTPIRFGQKWFFETILEDAATHQQGWGVIANEPPITTWGGTIDGIRGLLACGVDFKDSVIEQQVNWLISEQKNDGAFESSLITWSSVEVTAWVVITLRQLKLPLDDEVFKNARLFLESCIQNDGGLGTSKIDDVRTYPSAMTLLALDDLSPKAERIANFLKRSFNRERGGWGNLPNTKDITVMATTYSLFALLSTGKLRQDDDLCVSAKNYLLSQMTREGLWEHYMEPWSSKYQHDRAAPNPCHHFMTPWVIRTLLKAGMDPFDKRLIHATTSLVRSQLPSGAWYFAPDIKQEHTWCVANTLVCLSEMRSMLITPIVNAAANSDLINAQHDTRPAARFLRIMTRENLNSTLIFLLASFIFHDAIFTLAQWLLVILKLPVHDIPNIIDDIVASVILAGFLGLYTLFVRRFRPVQIKVD